MSSAENRQIFKFKVLKFKGGGTKKGTGISPERQAHSHGCKYKLATDQRIQEILQNRIFNRPFLFLNFMGHCGLLDVKLCSLAATTDSD